MGEEENEMALEEKKGSGSGTGGLGRTSGSTFHARRGEG